MFWFEYFDVVGDSDLDLLGMFFVEFGGVVIFLLGFMLIKIDVVFSSCICWCLLIRSFEVKDYLGVCF